MLFSSYTFLFAFLPMAFVLYHSLRYAGLYRTSIVSLSLCSLFFYGWWNPKYIFLLVPLMLANYGIALLIIRYQLRTPVVARILLVLGLTGNLAVLAYFKYANFLVDNIDALLGIDFVMAQVVLPLGISFFTFQKIAFLVDAYRGKVKNLNLLDFSLFVSFFPQLIAGPIVHHSEVLPQFQRRISVTGQQLMMGITIFVIGLAKKLLLADTAALYATPVFTAVTHGTVPDFITAWSGALAYTTQLYFDFSGYSDMAIGSALLFGIHLPINFASPYKATSIVEFWRRWHITLSRFLRDYLYIALGGNRYGNTRRLINLFITMLLGGLWHGAAWTYMFWGALHGCYLIINHVWRRLCQHLTIPNTLTPLATLTGGALTFLAVVVGWVFFRSDSIVSAMVMLQAMFDVTHITTAFSWAQSSIQGLVLAGALLALAWFTPNTQEWMGYSGPNSTEETTAVSAATKRFTWQPSLGWAIISGVVLAAAVLSLSKVSEFLYFQF